MFVDKIAKWLMFLCCIFECRLKIKFLMSYVLWVGVLKYEMGIYVPHRVYKWGLSVHFVPHAFNPPMTGLPSNGHQQTEDPGLHILHKNI